MRNYIILISLLILNVANADDYHQLRVQGDAILITQYHDILKSFSGNYRQIFFATPHEGKQERGSGKSENKIILNERYLEINSNLSFQNESVHKKIIIGFDGIKKKYTYNEFTGVETFSLTAEGVFSFDEKSIIFEGIYPHKILNENRFKIVFKFVDSNTFTNTLYEYEGGKEFKIIETFNYKLD